MRASCHGHQPGAVSATGMQECKRLLRKLAIMLQGKSVVRLKGGCPSVFSRCSSELRALAAAGCPAELVPGVSSALAAPLFAGMPLAMPLFWILTMLGVLCNFGWPSPRLHERDPLNARLIRSDAVYS